MQDRSQSSEWVTVEAINSKGARTRILTAGRTKAQQVKLDLLEAGYKVHPTMRVSRERPARPKWEQIRAVEILSQIRKLKQESKPEIQK